MLKVTIETDEGTEVMDLSAEEQKAFEFVANGPLEWIQNAIQNRVRRAVDQIVSDASDKNPKKTDVAEKLTIVKDADIKSAKVRQEEFEALNG
jgi:hypothetical protein